VYPAATASGCEMIDKLCAVISRRPCRASYPTLSRSNSLTRRLGRTDSTLGLSFRASNSATVVTVTTDTGSSSKSRLTLGCRRLEPGAAPAPAAAIARALTSAFARRRAIRRSRAGDMLRALGAAAEVMPDCEASATIAVACWSTSCFVTLYTTTKSVGSLFWIFSMAFVSAAAYDTALVGSSAGGGCGVEASTSKTDADALPLLLAKPPLAVGGASVLLLVAVGGTSPLLLLGLVGGTSLLLLGLLGGTSLRLLLGLVGGTSLLLLLGLLGGTSPLLLLLLLGLLGGTSLLLGGASLLGGCNSPLGGVTSLLGGCNSLLGGGTSLLVGVTSLLLLLIGGTSLMVAVRSGK